MATVNKNFRIKHGLVVEGTSGTINGLNILTESQDSQDFILDLIGGETLVKSTTNQFEVSAGGELSLNRTVVDAYYDAAGAASTAQDNAETYTDNALESYTLTEDLDATVDGYGYLKSADLSGYATETYVNTAVDNLVDGAPGLLDTLNEIAAAIADDENYATTMTTALAGKQNSLTPGSNIDITDDTISVTGLDTADVSEDASALYFTDTRAKDAVSSALGAGIEYVNGSFDVQVGEGLEVAGGTGNEIVIDRETVDAWYDAAGAASAAQSAAETHADGLVDDLLDATTPFTEINVNDQAKQIAATASINTGSASTVYQWAKADYRSAKLLVKVDNGTHNEISEILVTLDSSDNVAITEYAIVGTNGSRGTIDAVVSGSNVLVTVNPTNNSTVKVTGTLLK